MLSVVRLALMLLVMGLLLTPVMAQEALNTQPTGQQQSDAAAQYEAQCRRHGVTCRLDYGEKLEPPKPRQNRSEPRMPRYGSSGNNLLLMGLIILGLLVALGLWFYFGSGGVLLSSTSRERKAASQVPENWQHEGQNGAETAEDFFAKMAGMANRQEALVQVLRHCLLYAATSSNTRLARSDTERLVLRRLPENLPRRSDLEGLLRQTELAHYGGAPVTPAQFAELLDLARAFVQTKSSGGSVSHA